MDASLFFMEIVKFAMSFWCCSWCLLLELPSFSSRNLESQFNSESNLFCRGLPSTLWCWRGPVCLVQLTLGQPAWLEAGGAEAAALKA